MSGEQPRDDNAETRESAPPSTASVGEVIHGLAGSPGVALGRAVVIRDLTGHVRPPCRSPAPGPHGAQALRACRGARPRGPATHGGARRSIVQTESSILEAYVPWSGTRPSRRRCAPDHRAAPMRRVGRVQRHRELRGPASAVRDPYLRERSHDIEFIGDRLLRALGGRSANRLPSSTAR